MYHASLLSHTIFSLSRLERLIQAAHGSLKLALLPSSMRMSSSSGVVAKAIMEENEVDRNSGVDMVVEYPVPVSPFAGEVSKGVELQRALVAEAAMKAGPAISRDNVLFEDEWLMIVNKPRGLYCEHVFATVSSLCCSSGETQPHLHMANRLDRDTSGIMVITKCKEAAAKLTRAFTNREVQKTYLAQCARPSPKWRKIKIESGHGRSRYGAWRVYAKQDIGRRLPGGSTVRDMVTKLEIVAELDVLRQDEPSSIEDSCFVVVVGSKDEVKFVENEELEEEEEITVVRAVPETGRTHQIRLHCQYLGLPLCGDVKYGGPLLWQGITYDSHALHAESLAFNHPITKEPIHIVAPCPKWATQSGVKAIIHKSSKLF